MPRALWRDAPCVVCGEVQGFGSRGRCARCYGYLMAHGYDRPASIDLIGTPRPCEWPGCPVVTRARRRGWCSHCYQKWWRSTPAGQAATARAVRKQAAQRKAARAARRGGGVMPAQLLRVTLGGLCFGLDVVDGRITGAAPVARWCVGKSAAWCAEYWRRRGARVEWLDL